MQVPYASHQAVPGQGGSSISLIWWSGHQTISNGSSQNNESDAKPIWIALQLIYPLLKLLQHTGPRNHSLYTCSWTHPIHHYRPITGEETVSSLITVNRAGKPDQWLSPLHTRHHDEVRPQTPIRQRKAVRKSQQNCRIESSIAWLSLHINHFGGISVEHQPKYTGIKQALWPIGVCIVSEIDWCPRLQSVILAAQGATKRREKRSIGLMTGYQSAEEPNPGGCYGSDGQKPVEIPWAWFEKGWEPWRLAPGVGMWGLIWSSGPIYKRVHHPADIGGVMTSKKSRHCGS